MTGGQRRTGGGVVGGGRRRGHAAVAEQRLEEGAARGQHEPMALQLLALAGQRHVDEALVGEQLRKGGAEAAQVAVPAHAELLLERRQLDTAAGGGGGRVGQLLLLDGCHGGACWAFGRGCGGPAKRNRRGGMLKRYKCVWLSQSTFPSC